MWEYFTSKKYYDNHEIKQIDQIYTPWSSWVVATSSDSLQAKSDAIKNFIDAVNQGIQYYNEHVDEAIEYISSNLIIPQKMPKSGPRLLNSIQGSERRHWIGTLSSSRLRTH